MSFFGAPEEGFRGNAFFDNFLNYDFNTLPSAFESEYNFRPTDDEIRNLLAGGLVDFGSRLTTPPKLWDTSDGESGLPTLVPFADTDYASATSWTPWIARDGVSNTGYDDWYKNFLQQFAVGRDGIGVDDPWALFKTDDNTGLNVYDPDQSNRPDQITFDWDSLDLTPFAKTDYADATSWIPWVANNNDDEPWTAGYIPWVAQNDDVDVTSGVIGGDRWQQAFSPDLDFSPDFSPTFSPNFNPNFSPNFANQFANMFQGFNPLQGLEGWNPLANVFEGFDPLSGLDFSGVGGAGGIGQGGAGGNVDVTNLFGDHGIFGPQGIFGAQGIFGDTPLVGPGAVSSETNITDLFGEHGIFGPGGIFGGQGLFEEPVIDFGESGIFGGSPLVDFGNFGGNPFVDMDFGEGPLAEAYTSPILNLMYESPETPLDDIYSMMIEDPRFNVRDQMPQWLLNPADLAGQLDPWLRQAFGLEEDQKIADLLYPEGWSAGLEEAIKDHTTRLGEGLNLGWKEGDFGVNLAGDTEYWGERPGRAGKLATNVAGYDEGLPPEFTGELIDDYGEFLRMPLYDTILSSLDAANPYDTRRDAMLGGEDARIEYEFDQMRDEIDQRYAENLGSPAYRAELRDLSERKARAKMGVESEWAKMAAGQDEALRRGRTDDLARIMSYEEDRVMREMDYQNELARQRDADYYNWLDAYTRQYYLPQKWQDEGTRMALGGIGSTLNPSANIGEALDMSGISDYYKAQGDRWSDLGSELFQSRFFQPEDKGGGGSGDRLIDTWKPSFG